ncbi:CGNR zinc finger domain-containing protein [Prauserella alba]|uniref:CGNR zinc finger domain-containing protein n=1 Tax=Prauserella alba TaxID=176898 RepID=A0ABN1VCX2_9PSEU
MPVTTSGRNHCLQYTGDVNADVKLVLDFLNTLDVEDDTDVLRSAAEWHAWAHARELTPGPIEDATRARRALREAAGDPAPGPGTADTARELRIPLDVAFRVSPAADPQLVADDAVSAVFTAAMRLGVLGDWRRIKICPADDCLWAFYDESRNRSRTWCSMQVCGNRVKARTFRKRAGSTGDDDSTAG